MSPESSKISDRLAFLRRQSQANARILILEDDQIDLELIKTTLQQGGINGEFVTAENRETFVNELQRAWPDIILADYVLPGFDGDEALALKNDFCPEVPFILVSGVLGEEQAIESLKQGATDYVLKQRIGRLVPCVRRALQESEARSQRRQVAKALKETDNLLRAVIEASPIGIITMTREQRIITWNAAAETLYGYSADIVIDRPLPLITPLQQERFDFCFSEVLQNRTIQNQEYQHRKRNGGLVEVSLSLAPLYNDSNTIYGVVMTAVDITLQKQMEAQRMSLLRQESSARAAAESANRIKDEFLAVLSHELRTPLNSIVGWIHLLQRGHLKPDVYERALDTIERNATAQTQLIEDLLDLSRIIRGQVTLNIQPVDIASLIHATIDTVRPALEAKLLHLETRIDPQLPIILGDPNRLQQVIWNLLSNAIKFTPARGSITVQALAQSQNVRIQVSDSGIGIPNEFLPYVFEHFRQADGSSTRSQGGLGLGLAICRRLVEQHGGTIQVKSAGPDQGATFTVSLPMRLTQATIPTPESQNETLSLDGIKAIVIDDEADSRELVQVMLEQFGAEVECASSVSAAMQTIESFRPTVIISDIGMPEEDGYDFIRALRTLPDVIVAATPAIALTAYARDEDEQRALALGYQSHIAKPFNPREIASMVYQLANDISE